MVIEKDTSEKEIWNIGDDFLKALHLQFIMCNHHKRMKDVHRLHEELLLIETVLDCKSNDQQKKKTKEHLNKLIEIRKNRKVSWEPFVEFEKHLRSIMESKNFWSPKKEDTPGL